MSPGPARENAPRLIVNADDLGLSQGISEAIFAGHDRGIVTSTSVMATGVAFAHAARGALARPTLGCGVHLVLHDDAPVLPRARVPALVGANGKMRPLGATVRALLAGRLPEAEIEAEYAAQIERVLATGIRPTHLDSHCHLHGFARTGAVLHRLGARYGIPCARRAELDGWAALRGASPARVPVALLIHTAHRRMRAKLSASLKLPDRLIGLVRSGELDGAWIERAILGLRDGEIAELMVHPGDGSGAGDPDGDHGPAMRKRELDAVTSPGVRAALVQRGARLVTYRELASR